MGNGNVRNKPCWCGSGKKYKKCHLNRENEEPQNIWELGKSYKKNFNVAKCSAPESFKENCKGKIVRAHTVPKSGSLKQISRNGHVYSYVPSVENLIKNKGQFRPTLLGINKASTFSGFCAYHDRVIFAPIEAEAFVGSPEHCFLLGYRATSREHYTKHAAGETIPYMARADAGKPYGIQRRIQGDIASYEEGVKLGKRDGDLIKSKFDTILEERSYSENSRALVFEFENPCDVMCSGSWFPTKNLDGETLQQLGVGDIDMQVISMSSFSSEAKGYIVFQWLTEDSEVALSFLNSVLKLGKEHFPEIFLKLMIRQLENIHIRPEWWEGLSEVQKKYLGILMGDILGRKNILDPNTPRFKLSWNFEKYYPVGFEFT